jgi:hypothetical protein
VWVTVGVQKRWTEVNRYIELVGFRAYLIVVFAEEMSIQEAEFQPQQTVDPSLIQQQQNQVKQLQQQAQDLAEKAAQLNVEVAQLYLAAKALEIHGALLAALGGFCILSGLGAPAGGILEGFAGANEVLGLLIDARASVLYKEAQGMNQEVAQLQGQALNLQNQIMQEQANNQTRMDPTGNTRWGAWKKTGKTTTTKMQISILYYYLPEIYDINKIPVAPPAPPG